MKFVAAFIIGLALIASPARAQFAEALQPSSCTNCSPDDVAALKKIQASAPQAIGGAVGSPTFVMPPQKASSGIITISQPFAEWLQPYIDAVTNALIAAAAAWVLNWMRIHWNINLDEKQRNALTTALQNQAGSLIADGMVKVDGAKVDVHDGALAHAANELIKTVPDAATHFGLTPEFVAARIVDTIPQIAAGAQMLAKKNGLP